MPVFTSVPSRVYNTGESEELETHKILRFSNLSNFQLYRIKCSNVPLPNYQ